jgi:outer membrane receptor protein involved in Fe transport
VENGNLVGMRSPFNPAATGGPGQMLPADAATLYQLGIGVAAAQGAIDPATAAFLASLSPTSSDIALNFLDASTGAVAPLTSTSVRNVEKLKKSTATTFEVGYQGLLNDKILIAADLWYSKREDFVSPLVITTPLLLLDGASLVGYLVPPLTQAIIAQSGGLIDPETAQALALAQATQLADGGDGPGGVPGLAEIPLGVVSAPGVDGSAANLLLTYVNAGDVDMIGADFAIKAFLNDRWTLAATGSWVSDDYFDLTEIEGGIAPVALNAPALKGTLSLAYRNVHTGINAEARLRSSAGFPAESAGFTGTTCETGPREDALFEEDCVDGYTLVDFTAGYKLPNTRATIKMTISNVFDTDYRSFVGVPNIGRFLMAQIQYDLF